MCAAPFVAVELQAARATLHDARLGEGLRVCKTQGSRAQQIMGGLLSRYCAY
jgi:hypothetical protein